MPQLFQPFEIAAQFREFSAPPQRARAGGAAGQPHGTARVDKCQSALHGTHVSQQTSHPCRRRDGRVHEMRQRIGQGIAGNILRCSIQRQEEQGTRVRDFVPFADRVGNGAIAHEHRMHGIAEILLHEQRGTLIGADEVRQRAQDGSVAELDALIEQAGRRRRQSNAIALELLERMHAALQRRQRLIGAEQVGARQRFTLTRLAISRA